MTTPLTISRTLRVLRGVPVPGSIDRSHIRVSMLRVLATKVVRR